MGPKSWVYDIKNYIESKLNSKLFDRIIAAWKVDNKIYEKKEQLIKNLKRFIKMWKFKKHIKKSYF